MAKKPVRNYFKARKLKKELKILQSMVPEAGRDPLNPSITNAQSTAGQVDENNYSEYASQVEALYKMYDAESEYGAEIAKGIVETRAAFIGGEGINVNAKGATKEFIEEFLKTNKLHGSRLLDMINLGELEGRDLVRLFADKKNKQINVRSIPWINTKYEITVDKMDRENILKIEYTDSKGEKKTLNQKKMVFVRLGGSHKNINKTSNRIHSILTQIENFSRAMYDLRTNTHVFGKYMPYWKTATKQEAAAINNDIQALDWEIGYGYAGTADFSIVEPSGAASKAIIEDILINLKAISSTTGIPIHWLAWPELMSNRATADSLIEVISASTKMERLIWEEAFTLIIEKAMDMAIDEYGADQNIKGPFTVTLPIVSTALLEQATKVWQPLWADKLVSKNTVQNKLPGIDPMKENVQIKKEEKEDGADSPLNNKTTDDTIKKLQEEANGANEDSGEQARAG